MNEATDEMGQWMIHHNGGFYPVGMFQDFISRGFVRVCSYDRPELIDGDEIQMPIIDFLRRRHDDYTLAFTKPVWTA